MHARLRREDEPAPRVGVFRRRCPSNPARDLAYWTGQAGNAAGARDQSAALLPLRERVLGPEHPDTLTARRVLAHWTRKADRDTERGVK